MTHLQVERVPSALQVVVPPFPSFGIECLQDKHILCCSLPKIPKCTLQQLVKRHCLPSVRVCYTSWSYFAWFYMHIICTGKLSRLHTAHVGLMFKRCHIMEYCHTCALQHCKLYTAQHVFDLKFVSREVIRVPRDFGRIVHTLPYK